MLLQIFEECTLVTYNLNAFTDWAKFEFAQVVFLGVYLLTPSKSAVLKPSDLEAGLVGPHSHGDANAAAPLLDVGATLGNHSRLPSDANAAAFPESQASQFFKLMHQNSLIYVSCQPAFGSTGLR